MLVIQIRFDIFPLRNRNFRNHYASHTGVENNEKQLEQASTEGFLEAGDNDYEVL